MMADEGAPVLLFERVLPHIMDASFHLHLWEPYEVVIKASSAGNTAATISNGTAAMLIPSQHCLHDPRYHPLVVLHYRCFCYMPPTRL